MRTTALLVGLGLALSACGGDGTCQLTTIEGLFEPFNEGCAAVAVDTDPTKPFAVMLEATTLKVWVDALDEVVVWMPGYLYPGRRGACQLAVSTTDYNHETGHCDFRVSDVSHPTEKSTKYSLELLDTYLSVGGEYGILKGKVTVEAFDQGFGR